MDPAEGMPMNDLTRVNERDSEDRQTRMSQLPSPPLTRVGTRESDFEGGSGSGGKDVAVSVAQGEESSPERQTEQGEELRETDMGELDPSGAHADQSLDIAADDLRGDAVDSKEARLPSPTSPGHPSAHGLTIQPPQLWEVADAADSPDLVEVPEGRRSRESKKFGSLQRRLNPQRKLIPQSVYYFGPPPPDSAYGTPPIGQIGFHHPREIIRIERDYTGGELIQFAPIYPLELAGRITPTQFLESINAINEILISAHSAPRAFFDNFLAVFTLQLSPLFLTSHYQKEMQSVKTLIKYLNQELYHPAGLNMLWPQKVAFLFLEIEYY